MLAKIRTTPPAVQPDLLVRPELLSLLEKPIVVLNAPAGYGKSQLLWLLQLLLMELHVHRLYPMLMHQPACQLALQSAAALRPLMSLLLALLFFASLVGAFASQGMHL